MRYCGKRCGRWKNSSVFLRHPFLSDTQTAPAGAVFSRDFPFFFSYASIDRLFLQEGAGVFSKTKFRTKGPKHSLEEKEIRKRIMSTLEEVLKASDLSTDSNTREKIEHILKDFQEKANQYDYWTCGETVELMPIGLAHKFAARGYGRLSELLRRPSSDLYALYEGNVPEFIFLLHQEWQKQDKVSVPQQSWFSVIGG